MAVYAYLCVSEDTQDVDIQKREVLEYCDRQSLGTPRFIEDHSSDRMAWHDRPIGQLLEQAKPGDTIVATEVSLVARSARPALQLLQRAAEKNVSVHIANNQVIIDASISTAETATILGLVTHIERALISGRTKTALARRKARGLPMGRPKGPAAHLKLDPHRAAIATYLKQGVSKRSIARIIGCSPSTLYTWMKRRNIT